MMQTGAWWRVAVTGMMLLALGVAPAAAAEPKTDKKSAAAKAERKKNKNRPTAPADDANLFKGEVKGMSDDGKLITVETKGSPVTRDVKITDKTKTQLPAGQAKLKVGDQVAIAFAPDDKDAAAAIRVGAEPAAATPKKKKKK